jgi:hypothetical protein
LTSARLRTRRGADWLFRSRQTGRLVIVQWPNLALALVITADVARRLLHTHGEVNQTLRWAGSAALVWWSLDEIIRGANPFRRALGVVVLARLILRIAAPGSALG